MGKNYTLTGDESQRIDVLKFLSILLVVLIHAYDAPLARDRSLAPVMAVEDLFYSILTRSAVPLFFLTASVLLFKRERTYSQVLKTKARTVALPYFLWNSFWILVFIVLQTLPFTAELFSGDSVPIVRRGLAGWLKLYGIGSFEPQDYPLWFLRDLIVVILISPLLWKLADRFPRLTLGAVLVSLPFLSIDISMVMAIQYTLLGALIVKWDLHAEDADRVPLWLTVLVYGAAVALVYFVRLDILKRPLQLLGVFFWIRVSTEIRGKSRDRLLRGAQSLFMIYAAHELTLTCFKKLYYKFVPATPLVVLLSYFLIPAFIVALCIGADRLTKRFTPRFHSLITGGR